MLAGRRRARSARRRSMPHVPGLLAQPRSGQCFGFFGFLLSRGFLVLRAGAFLRPWPAASWSLVYRFLRACRQRGRQAGARPVRGRAAQCIRPAATLPRSCPALPVCPATQPCPAPHGGSDTLGGAWAAGPVSPRGSAGLPGPAPSASRASRSWACARRRSRRRPRLPCQTESTLGTWSCRASCKRSWGQRQSCRR